MRMASRADIRGLRWIPLCLAFASQAGFGADGPLASDAIVEITPEITPQIPTTFRPNFDGAWQKDFGVRIDHILLSPQASDRLISCDIDKTPRGKEKPSDHTPVWCEIKNNEDVF